MLKKVIFINIAVFVVIRLMAVFFELSGINFNYLPWVGVPSNFATLITHPWTLITYMFTQYDILHILFNMLWLYWFGVMFLNMFTPKQFFALYIYGGLGGAVLYLLAYLTLFSAPSFLIGSSAAVIAIVVATAFRAPEYPVNLLFFGAVKLKWIALVTIFLDIISITSGNAGGHISHLGGAAVGALFAVLYAKGIDITSPLNKFIDNIVSLFSRRPKIYVGRPPKKNSKSSAKKGASNTQSQKQSDIDEMDKILEKIKQSGYTALTDAEKDRLFNISKKI